MLTWSAEPSVGVQGRHSQGTCPVSDSLFNARASGPASLSRHNDRPWGPRASQPCSKAGTLCVPETSPAGSRNSAQAGRGALGATSTWAGGSIGDCCPEHREGHCPSQATAPRLPEARASYPQTLNGHPRDAKRVPQRPRVGAHLAMANRTCSKNSWAPWGGLARRRPECRQCRPGEGSNGGGMLPLGALTPLRACSSPGRWGSAACPRGSL